MAAAGVGGRAAAVTVQMVDRLRSATDAVVVSETPVTVRLHAPGRDGPLVLMRPHHLSGRTRDWDARITTTAGEVVRTPPLPDPVVIALVAAWSDPTTGTPDAFTAIGDLLGAISRERRTLAQHTFDRDNLRRWGAHTPVLSPAGCYSVAGAVEPYPGHWPTVLIFDAACGRLDGIWPYMM